eukprot:15632-Pleurochrysis_carterae.AAC.4
MEVYGTAVAAMLSIEVSDNTCCREPSHGASMSSVRDAAAVNAVTGDDVFIDGDEPTSGAAASASRRLASAFSLNVKDTKIRLRIILEAFTSQSVSTATRFSITHRGIINPIELLTDALLHTRLRASARARLCIRARAIHLRLPDLLLPESNIATFAGVPLPTACW